MKLLVPAMIAMLAAPLNLAAAGFYSSPLAPQTQQVVEALEVLDETPLQDGDLNRLMPEDLADLGYEAGSFKKSRVKAGLSLRNLHRTINNKVGKGSLIGGAITGVVSFLALTAAPFVGAAALIGWAIAPETVAPVIRKGIDGTVTVVKGSARVGAWFLAGGVLHLTSLTVLTYSLKKRIFIDLLSGSLPEARLLKWNPVDKKTRIAKVMIDQKTYYLIESGYTGKRIKWTDIIGPNSKITSTSIYKLNNKSSDIPDLELIAENKPIGDDEKLRLLKSGMYVLEAGAASLQKEYLVDVTEDSRADHLREKARKVIGKNTK